MKEPKQAIAAKELARGKSIREIAQELGVTERTITNWKADPKFNPMIEEEVNRVILELETTADKAKQVFQELLDSQNERIKLRAAEDIFKIISRRLPALAPTASDKIIIDPQELTKFINAIKKRMEKGEEND